LENQGKLPPQPITNPRQDVNVISLRSGKELQDSLPKKNKERNEEEETEVTIKAEPSSENKEEKEIDAPRVPNAAPFPQRLIRPKKDDAGKV
jgi:hypothetical protein